MTTLTTGDTAPAFSGFVNANLTGASAVFHVKMPDKTVLTRAATIVDPAAGSVVMQWLDGDLALPGSCLVEVEATFSNGKKQTFALTTAGAKAGFLLRAQLA